MLRYKTLMDAVRCVRTAMTAEFVEQGGNTSPAWSKLWRIERYLTRQAENAMEGLAEGALGVDESPAQRNIREFAEVAREVSL